MFNSKKNLKMISASLAAAMLVLTMAGCSSPETGDASKADVKEKTSSTAAEESSEETAGEESKAEEPAESEAEEDTESSEASAVTTSPDDFDLDAMIASIEAEIPDITVYTPNDIGGIKNDDTSSTAEAGTTTTTSMPAANAPSTADLKSYQQFSFDGMTYDNTNILDSTFTPPSGWEDKGTSIKNYVNPLYPDFGISVSDSSILFVRTQNENSSQPSLQLYKGLTWGASASDVKAAYGEPMHEGKSEQYGTTLKNLFYKDDDGYLIIFEVSDDWGLLGVYCNGNR